MADSTAVVVVGVDGSQHSVDALRWALGQVQLSGGTVRAVSTWRWPNYVTRIPPGVDLEADTSRMLADTVSSVVSEFPGIDVVQHVVKGPPGPALLSQSEGATLLVVGARGRAAFPGMLLGSVAEYCVRNGPCPVVVVRTLDDTPT